MKKVLIILCSYNGAKYIEEQIKSILCQENVQVELFIFDDQSSDETANIIKKISINNINIKLFINSNPSGSAAKNFCNSIKSIPDGLVDQFDYIALSDQDDIWMPNKLKIATQTLSCHNADLYASNLILWEQKKNIKTLLKKDYIQKKYDHLFEGASAGCTYVFSSIFAKHLKIKLLKLNYQDWFYFSHDWLIYFIARLDKFKIVIDKKAEILYRIHSENIHGQLNINSLNAVLKKLNYVLNGWYFRQIEGYTQLLNPSSAEYKISRLYSKNIITRFWILITYNFDLIRCKKKFFKFALVSLLPRINK